MKIGIVTLPLQYNYGGILQAYALQTVLERMGHDVRVIRQCQIKDIPSNAFLRYVKRFLLKIVYGSGEVFIEKNHNKEFPVLTSKTWKFVEKYIKSYVIKDYFNIPQSEFDCFVVGSDQVWRSGYTKSVLNYFLDFAEGWAVKRIAYAASFGLDKWPITKKDTGECNRLAHLFEAVSVREESGILLCKNYLGMEARHVLDPTMLLETTDYERLIENEYKERVFATYILDDSPEKKRILNEIEQYLALPKVKLFTKEHNDIQPLASIEEWLNAFRKSDFVLTDSFHGTVFSLIFNKQFVVLANTHRGNTRIESLLKIFHLENRLIYCIDDYSTIKETPIDYKIINPILVEWRKNSLCYLEKALSL